MVTLLIEKNQYLYLIKAKHAIVAAIKKNKLMITLFEPEVIFDELMKITSDSDPKICHIEGFDSCHFI